MGGGDLWRGVSPLVLPNWMNELLIQCTTHFKPCMKINHPINSYAYYTIIIGSMQLP